MANRIFRDIRIIVSQNLPFGQFLPTISSTLLNIFSDVPLPSSKTFLRAAVVLIVILAISAGYFEVSLEAANMKYEKRDRDFKRLQRYIGTDKSLELLKKE